ncbi:MAG: hypothetical protein ACRDRU_28150 [Pseudonocardiaceae bacterium]
MGAAGNVTCELNINAAAILLASQGNVPLKRTAHLMAALDDTPVSTGLDEAMAQVLRAQDVLCGDPTNVISKNTDTHGQPVPGSPHTVTVRTPNKRLVYYAPIGSRSKTAIAGLGVLDSYADYLVASTTPAGSSSTPSLSASSNGPGRSSLCCARPPP